MDQPSGRVEGEIADEVLAYARARGYAVTGDDLERRRQAGVIPRPRQVALGRGRGSITVYPSGTGRQLLAALELEPRHRSFERVAWELWLAGYDVPMPSVRSFVLSVATLHDRIAGILRPLGFAGTWIGNRALHLVEQLTRLRRVGQVFDGARRRLGRHERFETLLRMTLEISQGTYRPPAQARILGASDDEGRLLESALGIESARTDGLPGVAPWLRDGSAPALRDMAGLLGGRWAAKLEALSDEELIAARDRWVRLRRGLVCLGEGMRELLGERAFGFPQIADLIRRMDPVQTAAAVFVFATWTKARDAHFEHGAEVLIEATAKWERDMAVTLPVVRALRTVPALREALAPARMAVAFKSETDLAQLHEELRAVAAEDGEAIRDALATACLDVPGALPS